MADKKATLIIELKDLATAGLDKFKKNLETLEQNVVKLGASFAVLSAFVFKAVTEFGEQEAATLRLDIALRNMDKSAVGAGKRLEELATQQSKLTGFQDTAIVSMQAMLANMGFNEEAIAQLTPRVLDLSRAYGKDLTTTALSLGKAIENGSSAPLKRMGVFLDDASFSGRNFAGTMDQIDGKVKGVAVAFGNTTRGGIEKFHASLNRLVEALGGAMAKTFNPLVQWATRLLDHINSLDPKFLAWAGKIILVGTALTGAVAALAAVVTGMGALAAAAPAALGLATTLATTLVAALTAIGLPAIAAGAALAVVSTNLFGLRTVLVDIANIVPALSLGLVKMMTGDFAGAAGIVKEAFVTLKDDATSSFEQMKTGASNAYNFISDLYQNGIPTAPGAKAGAAPGGGGKPNVPGGEQYGDDEFAIKLAQMKGYTDEAERRQLQHELKMRGISEKEGQGRVLLDAQLHKQRLAMTASTFQNLATLQNAKTKELQMVGKAAAVSEAIMRGALAAQQALSAPPGPPFSFAYVASVAAMSAMNIATITGVNFAEGGMALPTPGGTFGRFAEAGKAEAVVPLDDPETKAKLADTFGGGNAGVTIQAGIVVADRMSIKEFARMIDEELFKLGRMRQRVS
jgi:hypothetical protein